MGLVFVFLLVPSLLDFGNYLSCLLMLWDVLELPVSSRFDKISAGDQPQLIQGTRRRDGVGEGQDTIVSIRY